MMRHFLLGIFFAAMLCPLGRAQTAAQSQLVIQLWLEAQKFLNDCSAYPSGSGDATVCENSRLQFIKEYDDGMTGNPDAQWDVGFLFTRGAPYAVITNPTLSCAWWIVADDSGGSSIAGQTGKMQAAQCRTFPDAVTAAQAIEAEMAKIQNALDQTSSAP